MNILELANIDKSFGGVHALRSASLSARAGEIHAICGENGAGKSTLLKILSGVYPRDSYGGSIRVRTSTSASLRSSPSTCEEQVFESTRDAERAGIAIVHQELMLVPELSVAQNLMLGRELGSARTREHLFSYVDDDAMEAEAVRLLKDFGVERDVDPLAPIASLGIGLQQVVEIVRALSRKANILILDEPTAALTGDESKRLFKWLRDLRGGGTTCLYVSHRMDEIFALSDRVTILRDGKTVSTVDVDTSSTDEVVSLMVGRAVSGKGKRATPRPPTDAQGYRSVGSERSTKPAEAAIELRDLAVLLEEGIQVSATSQADKKSEKSEKSERTYAARASFTVARGEIVALAGAMGSGRTALLSAIFGSARSGTTGSIHLEGREVRIDSPIDAIANGLAFVPEDRKGRGLVLGMTVAENLGLPPARTSVKRTFEWLDLVDEDEDELLAAKRIEELKIRGAASAEVATLSGGNQQKVVLGKWLECPPRVLLLDEPTRGVDIGAREEIYELVERLTERGAAIILASSDLPEVLRLAHRVLVLRQGRVIAELDGPTTTEEEIVALATGATEMPTSTISTTTSSSSPKTSSLDEAASGPRLEACAP